MAIVRDPFAPYRGLAMAGRGIGNVVGPAVLEAGRRVGNWVRNYNAAAAVVGAPTARELVNEAGRRVKGWARRTAEEKYNAWTTKTAPRPTAGPQTARPGRQPWTAAPDVQRGGGYTQVYGALGRFATTNRSSSRFVARRETHGSKKRAELTSKR